MIDLMLNDLRGETVIGFYLYLEILIKISDFYFSVSLRFSYTVKRKATLFSFVVLVGFLYFRVIHNSIIVIIVNSDYIL